MVEYHQAAVYGGDGRSGCWWGSSRLLCRTGRTNFLWLLDETGYPLQPLVRDTLH